MKRKCLIVACLMAVATMAAKDDNGSIRERCFLSLCRFMQYAKSIYVDAGVNSLGDSVGYFKAWNPGESNEDGVRTNADMAMVMAFVYTQLKNVDIESSSVLPENMAVASLRDMSKRALRYAYSTHRSNRLMTCTDGRYWGSSPLDDSFCEKRHQWESSLWAMSVAMAGGLLKDELASEMKYICNLLVSEADFQLTRVVPTGYEGDTKAEENGWEANVLACACAMIPSHPNHSRWYEAMNRYGFNCYTVAADANDTTLVEGRMAKEWYEGQNLYDDFTLQNHAYFHTSYQNVVMQEQAESIVAYRLLRSHSSLSQSVPETLTWHWDEVWEEVLAPLALPDGELAMPNGNDWSMFLFDQLPAFAAMSTLRQNADALMLEKRCLDQLLARQATTNDGAYMLNADIGPRRMGVTAHRVMMTCLLHDLFPASVTASTWEDFVERHLMAKEFPSQHVVRGMSKERFTCFSWSKGLDNCTGIIVPNSVENAKIMIPYKKGFGGNLIGEPKKMVERPFIITKDNEWIAFAGGHEPFCVWSTPGNAVIVSGCPVYMALSFDPISGGHRDVRYGDGWVNVDDFIGIVGGKDVSLGALQTVSSINTAVLSSTEKAAAVVYYTDVSRALTEQLASKLRVKSENGVVHVEAEDTDGSVYRLEFDADKRHVKKETIKNK